MRLDSKKKKLPLLIYIDKCGYSLCYTHTLSKFNKHQTNKLFGRDVSDKLFTRGSIKGYSKDIIYMNIMNILVADSTESTNQNIISCRLCDNNVNTNPKTHQRCCCQKCFALAITKDLKMLNNK